jgi:hypothetical protein
MIKNHDIISKHLKTKIVFFDARNCYVNTDCSCNTTVFNASVSVINKDYG